MAIRQWFFLAVACLTACTLLLLLLPWASLRSAEAERMLLLVRSSREDRRRQGLLERLSGAVFGPSTAIGRRVKVAQNEKLKRQLLQAGLRAPHAGEAFLAAQAIGLVGGCLLGSMIPVNTFFWVFMGAVLGFMAPGFWLTARIDRRRERMRRSVPDAIDLLVICVNAGLGLDQALMRLGEELNISHRELNEEFNRLRLERQAGKPRAEAWSDLAARTKIDELATFAAILSETDRFGTPIADALTVFAEELRTRRRQGAEEAAAKTKIKIIFPLVLCIFPCILLVLLGPAMLTILKTLGSMQR